MLSSYTSLTNLEQASFLESMYCANYVFVLLIFMPCVDCINGMSWLLVIRPVEYVKPKIHSCPNLKDRQCPPKSFCNRTEGICWPLKKENEACRRNKMCYRGMECVGGKCRQKILPRKAGEPCSKTRDCQYGFCCAREKGQLICKPMLKEGKLCGLSHGGNNYLLTNQCGCEYGFKCKRKKAKGLSQLSKDWNDDKRRKCVSHNTQSRIRDNKKE